MLLPYIKFVLIIKKYHPVHLLQLDFMSQLLLILCAQRETCLAESVLEAYENDGTA